MNFKVKIFQGKDILPWIDLIANLRITEFRGYPYLYAGDPIIEKDYLGVYPKDKNSLFTLVFNNNEVVGALTGIPLATVAEFLTGTIEAFKKNGLNPNDYYYYGEFIVLPNFRNQGISKILFDDQTKQVKSLGYKKLSLMTVDREENHRLKPKGYFNPDKIWKKFGFTKANMKIQIEWPTYMADGSIANALHSLSYWVMEKI